MRVHRVVLVVLAALALICPCAAAAPVPDNPSFDTSTATWAPNDSDLITRDTAVFDTAPASGRWDRGRWPLVRGDSIWETFTGTFQAGVDYTLTLRLKSSVANMGVDGLFGALDEFGRVFYITTGAWQTLVIPWTPAATTSTVYLTLSAFDSFAVMGALYIDSLRITAPSIPTCRRCSSRD